MSHPKLYYKHITLSGVSYIQAVNEYPKWGKGIFGDILLEQWDEFDKANPPIVWDGPAFDGTISESEIEKFDAIDSGNGIITRIVSDSIEYFKTNGIEVFKAANLKTEDSHPVDVRFFNDDLEDWIHWKPTSKFLTKLQIEKENLKGEGIYEFRISCFSKAARPKEVADHIGEINGMVNQPVQQEANDKCPDCGTLCFLHDYGCDTCSIPHKPSTPIVSEGEEKDYLINTKSAYSVYVAGFNHGFNEQNIIPEHGTIEAFERLMNGESPCLDGTMYNIPKQSLSNREEGRELQGLLPSSEDIEANGIEGGLRDNELQLFWEGATWLKNHLLKKLSPSSTPLEQKELSQITDEDLQKIGEILFSEKGYQYRFTRVESLPNVHKAIISLDVEVFISHPDIMEWSTLGHIQFDTEEFDINFLKRLEGEWTENGLDIEWVDDVIDSIRIVNAYRYLESKGYQI